LLENPIFHNLELLQLMIYLLLNAYFKDSKILDGDKELIIKKGSFATGRKKIAEELKVNESTLYKRLKKLEKLRFCNIESNNRFSIITVINWELYQLEDEESNSDCNNKVTTEEQQSNNKVTQKKNVKNVKKVEECKEVKIKTAIEIAIDNFKDFRKKIKKPMTDRAVELLLINLDKLATDDETKIKILDQSILNSWQGVFALKETNQQTPTKPTGKISFMDLV